MYFFIFIIFYCDFFLSLAAPNQFQKSIKIIFIISIVMSIYDGFPIDAGLCFKSLISKTKHPRPPHTQKKINYFIVSIPFPFNTNPNCVHLIRNNNKQSI